MNKIKYTNFETIKDIAKSIDFHYDSSKERVLACLEEFWESGAGKKISEMSRVYGISKDNTVTIVCADSFISNELYLEKDKILKDMIEKAEKMGIKIKDIKFDFRKWKEKNNE